MITGSLDWAVRRLRALLTLHRAPVRTRVLHGLAPGPQFALDLMQRYHVGSGTLYPALIRLEKEGLVHSAWAEMPEPRRRAYALTDAGRAHLASLNTYALSEVLEALS